MAIKPIEEIPLSLSDKRRSYREQIREDIKSAISQKIDKFEFEGDYNWKYLAQYAREEADMIWRKTYGDLIRKKKEAAGLNDGHYYVGGLPSFKLKGQYIKISSVKMPDRNHVYCSIDYDAPEKLTDQAIKEMLEDKAEEERKAAETTEKAKNKDLTAKIKDLEFSHRTRTVLLRAGVNTMADLQGRSRESINKIRNMGPKGTQETIDMMERFGIKPTGED